MPLSDPASFSQMNISKMTTFLPTVYPMVKKIGSLLGLVGFALSVESAEPLTSAREIRHLTIEQAHQKLPVRIEGIATFYHSDWGVLFIHDGDESICVGIPLELRPKRPYDTGTRLRIEGVVGPGEFLPVIWPDTIQEKGKGSLPAYQKVSVEDLFSPALDSHPVEVDAVVKGTSFSDQSLVVDLEINGRMVKALIPQHEALAPLPWQLLERRVHVRGVAGTHFNDQRQMSGRLLFVQRLDSFTLEKDEISGSEIPSASVDGLLRVDAPLRSRVRVRGIATYILPGRGIYLRGEGGSMFVQTAQPSALNRGDEFEAIGFPVVTPFRPSLSAIDVKKVADGGEQQPILFSASDQRNSREQCELITLETEFFEMTTGREFSTLLCRSDGVVFEALLPASVQSKEALFPGMKLRLTGICELVSTRPLVIPRTATGFRIFLRDNEDITVLARQPWWDKSHSLWVLGILGVAAIAIAAWAITLQVVVASQSNLIRQQTQQQATLEERQRIARDLHDTLEQELVGVNMLLDSTAMKLNGNNPEANEPLTLARRLLRRAREESRTTIRELRSVALESRGLPAAIDELLRPLTTASGAAFDVTITGQPFRLTGTMETHLLRLAQEAVANAAKHSHATRIDVRLDYSAEEITLEIEDNGCGFDNKIASQDASHFGLSGMQERADKISGKLRIQSSSKTGTIVQVTAPTVSFQSPHTA
jgi:signal transduction histidine kinase